MKRASGKLQRELTALGIAAPQVVGMRLAQYWLHAANPRAIDRREWQCMHLEKIDAFVDAAQRLGGGVFRIQQDMITQWTDWWMRPWQPPPSANIFANWQRNGTRLLASGLAPLRRRAVANACRLKRRSLAGGL